jgi:AAHS family 4-hydroxybenzoate transporter-like MFS transporter
MIRREGEMDAPRVVNVTDLIDRSRLGSRRLWVFALLAACLVMDGFDVQAVGYVAPALIRDWGIPSSAMGPVFASGLLGLFAGSIAFGVAADRLGRRPVLIGATLVFSLFTLLTARAGSVAELLAVRFVAGLGLGAMMPNATALVGEYSPGRQRVATMMIVTNGFMIGAVLGGLLSAWLVPAHGWRAVFWVGGLVPLLLVPAMVRWLPESLQFLVLRGRHPGEIGRWLARMGEAVPAGDVRYEVREARREGFPIVQLLRDGRAAATLLLWLVNFMNVLDAYFVASWLPTVLRDAGLPTSTAVLVGTTVQVGGAIGTVVLGLVLQRVGFVPVLASCFGVAAAGLAVIGRPGLALPLLVAVAFVVGWCIFGGQPGVNALAATVYPTDLRSSGLGAALGIGRFGAILGPLVAGELLRRSWTGEALFQAAALPAIVAAIAIVAFRWARPGAAPLDAPGPPA